MCVRSSEHIACTSLTNGLLEQNNLPLKLILRNHCDIVSLTMCIARFIPTCCIEMAVFHSTPHIGFATA